jgi:hyperosmotically inducible periplasmic protein
MNCLREYKGDACVKHKALRTAGLLFFAMAAWPAAAGDTRTAADEGTVAAKPVDDVTVAAKVSSALAEDPTIKAREIKVTSRHGRVLLSGFVTSAAEKMAASKVAAGVSGVKVVENNLEVRSP